jgi:hypothetical protein
MAPQFRSSEEFREVMDRIFGLMDGDPDMGPKLRDADVPQRFEFEDVWCGSGPTTSTGIRRSA